MVIDRPSFYFRADKIKHWLAIIILVSLVLSFIVSQYDSFAAGFLILVAILCAVAYVALWFLT